MVLSVNFTVTMLYTEAKMTSNVKSEPNACMVKGKEKKKAINITLTTGETMGGGMDNFVIYESDGRRNE